MLASKTKITGACAVLALVSLVLGQWLQWAEDWLRLVLFFRLLPNHKFGLVIHLLLIKCNKAELDTCATLAWRQHVSKRHLLEQIVCFGWVFISIKTIIKFSRTYTNLYSLSRHFFYWANDT